jgi:hypothetical protein
MAGGAAGSTASGEAGLVAGSDCCCLRLASAGQNAEHGVCCLDPGLFAASTGWLLVYSGWLVVNQLVMAVY